MDVINLPHRMHFREPVFSSRALAQTGISRNNKSHLGQLAVANDIAHEHVWHTANLHYIVTLVNKSTGNIASKLFCPSLSCKHMSTASLRLAWACLRLTQRWIRLRYIVMYLPSLLQFHRFALVFSCIGIVKPEQGPSRPDPMNAQLPPVNTLHVVSTRPSCSSSSFRYCIQMACSSSHSVCTMNKRSSTQTICKPE